MALRYSMAPDGRPWKMAKIAEILPAERPPVEVSFRPGCNMERVVQEAMECRSVKLSAPVGAGKTSVFPGYLARATKAVVFLVLPFRQAARSAYSYASKDTTNPTLSGLPMCMYEQDMEDVPKTGLVFIWGPAMVDLMQSSKGLWGYPGCTVMLDEAHDSNGFSEMLRRFTLALGARRFVMSSATFEPSGHRSRETAGTVKMVEVELGPPSEWQIDDLNSPFCYRNLQTGIVIFIDSRADAARLADLYRRAGLDVFRLTATSTDAEFDEAMRVVNSKTACLVALLVDYAYRSHFTFGLHRGVDTGYVTFQDSLPGQMRRLRRRMFEFEKVQAAGRLGRVPGEAVYYYQKGPCEAKICDIEGVEREAVALMGRCFGYEPSEDLKDTLIARNGLPDGVDIRAALTGVYPLSYLVLNPDSARMSCMPYQGFEHEVDCGVFQGPDPEVGVRHFGHTNRQFCEDWVRAVAEIGKAGTDYAPDVTLGKYYIPQVTVGDDPGLVDTVFPSGLDSVLQFSRSKTFASDVLHISRDERKWAFVKALNMYNATVAELRALKAALLSYPSESKREKAELSYKLERIFGRTEAQYDMASECLYAAMGFSVNASWYKECDVVLQVEADARQKYLQLMSSSRLSRSHIDLNADIAWAVKSSVDEAGNSLIVPAARSRGMEVTTRLSPVWDNSNKVSSAGSARWSGSSGSSVASSRSSLSSSGRNGLIYQPVDEGEKSKRVTRRNGKLVVINDRHGSMPRESSCYEPELVSGKYGRGYQESSEFITGTGRVCRRVSRHRYEFEY